MDNLKGIRCNESRLAMLRIRPDQLEAFEEAVRPSLVEEAVARLRCRHSPYFAALGSTVVFSVVDHGMRRAEQLGVGSTSGIDAVSELILILGVGFDRDPLLPWVSERLARSNCGIGEELPLLSGAVSRYVEETAGPDAVWMREALQRLAAFDWQRWSVEPGGERSAAIEQVLLGQYPEKMHALKRRGLTETLLRISAQTATQHGLDDDLGVLVVTVLTLLLGTHFHQDPQFPWARDSTTTTALLDQAVPFLDRVIMEWERD